jgi:hypothetical protein
MNGSRIQREPFLPPSLLSRPVVQVGFVSGYAFRHTVTEASSLRLQALALRFRLHFTLNVVETVIQ